MRARFERTQAPFLTKGTKFVCIAYSKTVQRIGTVPASRIISLSSSESPAILPSPQST